MRNTTVIEKLLQSVVNVLVTFIMVLPALFSFGFDLKFRVVWMFVFLVYNLICEFLWRRCIGMMVFGVAYDREKDPLEKILYSVLYALSFGTLLFSLWFPFDLLVINLCLIQLPCILFTGTTLHGWLSGGARTIQR